MTPPHFAPDEDLQRQVMAAFGQTWRSSEPGARVPGSPERSRWRTVVTDASGERYLLEEIAPENVARKQQIADALAYLAHQGLSEVIPQMRGRGGAAVLSVRGAFWQLRPHRESEPLPQPDWVWDAWRGAEWGRFLLSLRRCQNGMPARLAGDLFWLRTFIDDLSRRLLARRPPLLAAVQPALQLLAGGYLRTESQLPLTFNHGDCHAMNVLWAPRSFRAVIDWEFAGLKPVLYDAALIIGCVGVEEPDALSGPLVRALTDALWSDPALAAHRSTLAEMVLAARFAWLSEWLRKRDEEMVELETAYIGLLTRMSWTAAL